MRVSIRVGTSPPGKRRRRGKPKKSYKKPKKAKGGEGETLYPSAGGKDKWIDQQEKTSKGTQELNYKTLAVRGCGQ